MNINMAAVTSCKNTAFVTSETSGKLGRVNFHKDFWDMEKSCPIADRAYPVTLPLSIAGDVSAPVPLLVPKVANRTLQTSSEFYAQKRWRKFFFLEVVRV